MSQPTIEEAFEVFASTSDPMVRRQALSDLTNLKAIPKQAEDPRFKIGFEKWCQLITTDSATEQQRLLAIAELIRISRTAKKDWPKRVANILSPLFKYPLPPISLLDLGDKSADDRLNLARACSLIKAEWLPSYLAKGIAEEDLGENARNEMMKVLFTRVDSIAEAFELLTVAFTEVDFKTESPSDSMGRRVKRTLEVLRPTIVESSIDAGENVGEHLNNLLRKAFMGCGRPQEDKVKIELSGQVALIIHDLFRTRVSVAGEPDTFEALRWCRKFFQGNNWPTELRPTLEYLILDVSEALIFLCRQGKPSQVLLDCLEVACGYKERAQGITSRLAEKHVELPEDIRNWLIRWRVVNTVATSNTLLETQLQSIDAVVGMALLNANQYLASSSLVSVQVLSTLEIYEPLAIGGVQDVFSRADQIAKSIVEISKRRNIEVLGTVGEEVESAPKYFDFLGEIPKQRYIVLQPAIIRKRADGVVGEVVLKGIVE